MNDFSRSGLDCLMLWCDHRVLKHLKWHTFYVPLQIDQPRDPPGC
jgi:hypothetical protein